jgi:acyl-CoA thioester hydrolase
MANTIETYRGVVYPWEIDQMGHMNVRFYVAKFDEATWQLFGRLGMNAAYFRDNDRTMGAVQQNITYQREMFAGDLVIVQSELVELGERKLRFLHRMFDVETDEQVASADMIGVHIDRATRQATAFPQEVLVAGKALLA